MRQDDYPEQVYVPDAYPAFPPGRRGPGALAVVLTSFLTSLLVSLGVLVATGNLPILEILGLAEPSRPKPVEPAVVAKFSIVPTLVGMPVQAATAVLRERDLRVIVRSEEPDSAVAKGIVIKQEPLPESDLAAGEPVAVVISSGPPLVKLPDVAGRPVDEATEQIRAAGLAIGAVSENGAGEPGTVVQTRPAPGAELAQGAAVDLVVARSQVAVPKLLGLRTGAAKKALKKAGLAVGKLRWRYVEHRPANLVLSQDPKPGTMVAIGSAVELVLNEE